MVTRKNCKYLNLKPEAPLVAFLKNCGNCGVNTLKEDVESDSLQLGMTMEMQIQLGEK